MMKRFVFALYGTRSVGCVAAQALGRLLDRVVDEMADDTHFVEIDIAESPDIAQNAGITGTPTVQVKEKLWCSKSDQN